MHALEASEVSDGERANAASRRSSKGLLCLILVCVTLLTYRESLDHNFVTMDDYPYVVENFQLHDGLSRETLVWAMKTFHGASWFPLTWLSLALDVEISGLDPRGFHRTNLIFHSANAVLLFLALTALTGSRLRSFLTAGVFALHPLHVESVAWITERKDVLSGFFFMLTLWAWARYAERESPWRYLWVVACVGLGLLAKSSLVTLPLLLLLLDFWPLDRLYTPESGTTTSLRGTRRALLEKAPLLLLAVGAMMATYWAGVSGMALENTEQLSLLDRFANAAISYTWYLRDSFWPINLSPFYPHPGAEVSLMNALGATALLLGLTVFALSKIRSQPHLAVGWLWFLGSLVPMIGLVQAGAQARADRFMYLPQIGLCIALFWSIPSHGFVSRYSVRGMLLALAVVPIAVLYLLTQAQIGIWRNGVTLFEHTRAITPDSAFVRHGLGQAYLRAGRLEDAALEFRAALNLNPHWVRPMAAMGEVMSESHQPRRAATWFSRALEHRPDWVEVRRTLAELLVEQGHHQRAIPHLMKLVHARDYADNPEIHGVLGLAFARIDNPKAAEKHYLAALALRPAYPSVHVNLGFLLAEKGEGDLALFHLSEAVRLGNQDAEVQFARSKLLIAIGRERDGLAALRHAVDTRPNWLAPVNNLAWHLVSVEDLSLRDSGEAVRLATRAASLCKRDDPNVLETLATALGANRQKAKAAAVFDEAIALARDRGDLAFARRLAAQRVKLQIRLPTP